jgi:hypothetical protein
MENNDPLDVILIKLQTHLSVFEEAELKKQLVEYINYLILADFNRLVQLLYRIDINEQKLKDLLLENQQTDAAIMIGEMIIQRQIEKAKTREEFKSSNPHKPKDQNIPDDEKW